MSQIFFMLRVRTLYLCKWSDTYPVYPCRTDSGREPDPDWSGRAFRILRENNCRFVVVPGHPDYYPRFGFTKASAYGLKSQ